jgi:hypothetical protein
MDVELCESTSIPATFLWRKSAIKRFLIRIVGPGKRGCHFSATLRQRRLRAFKNRRASLMHRFAFKTAVVVCVALLRSDWILSECPILASFLIAEWADNGELLNGKPRDVTVDTGTSFKDSGCLLHPVECTN